MPYAVEITRVATGQTVTHAESGDWYEPGTEFWWRDGNMSCDCNRALRFADAGGNVAGDPGDCGDERFTCVAILPSGERISLERDTVTP